VHAGAAVGVNVQGFDAESISASVKEVMQQHVGMSRRHDGLALAATQLEALGAQVGVLNDSADELEVANLVTVGTLIAHSAWLRTESRGCHFRRDYPERDEAWRIRIMQRLGEAPSRAAVGGHMMTWPQQGGALDDSGAPVSSRPDAEQKVWQRVHPA
jgi:succinate dehydrogenase/fumarate reductase flavoprotein subunit